jgi:hypothetical protein
MQSGILGLLAAFFAAIPAILNLLEGRKATKEIKRDKLAEAEDKQANAMWARIRAGWVREHPDDQQ